MVMDTRKLTAGTQLAQAQALQLLTGSKPLISQDEARETLGLPPIEDPNQLTPTPAVAGGAPNG
jgi:hypothetical protein